MVYVIQVTVTACEQDQDGTSSALILLASCQQTFMTYTIAVRTVKNSHDGQRNCPKYVEFYSRNKFEKLVHLVGFIIRIKLPSAPRFYKPGHEVMNLKSTVFHILTL